MKYIKARLLLPIEVYEILKKYLKKEIPKFPPYKDCVDVNGYKITLVLRRGAPSYNKNKVILSILIKEGSKLLIKSSLYISNVCEILTVQSLQVEDSDIRFLACIDKDISDPFNFAKSKLSVMDFNINNIKYISNYILYSNFSNEIELIEVCYLLMINRNILKINTGLKDFIYAKLNYYGYTMDKTKDYSLDLFNVLKNSNDVVEKISGKILYDIFRYDNDCNCTIGMQEPVEDLNKVARKAYKFYINRLKYGNRLI